MVDLSGLGAFLPKGFDLDDKIKLLENILPSFIEEGYSQTGTLKVLRDNGFKIANETFSYTWRSILGIEKEYSKVRLFSKSHILRDEDLGTATNRMKTDYRFIFRATLYDEITGQQKVRYFGFDTNSYGSIGSLEQIALETFTEMYPGASESISSLRIWKGIKR